MTAAEQGDTGPEPAELDDTAAELDGAQVDPAEGYTEAEQGYSADDSETLTGVCNGGPYHGRLITCRFPRGFLLVDRASDRAWLYDWAVPSFELRAGAPETPPLSVGWWRAAGETGLDVIAYDGEVMPR